MGKSRESDVYYCLILHLQAAWAEHGYTLHHLNGGYFKGPEGHHHL